MTEEVTPAVTETSLPSDPVELIKLIQEKEKQISSLNAHKQELLDETKRAKRKAEEESQEKARMKEEQLRKNGEFEQLYKSATEREAALKAQIELRDQQKAKEVTKNEAMKLAAQLADGYNAELLATFVERRIKYTEEGVKVLDAHGNLTVSGLDELKNEFANSDKFKSLVRGSRATGGGALGSGGGTASASLIDKAVFETWTPKQKMEYSLKGGKVK
jgi:hypothetical protein